MLTYHANKAGNEFGEIEVFISLRINLTFIERLKFPLISQTNNRQTFSPSFKIPLSRYICNYRKIKPPNAYFHVYINTT